MENPKGASNSNGNLESTVHLNKPRRPIQRHSTLKKEGTIE